jgi:16S rRNA (guanine527-N7)-methyltransferase
VKRLTIYAELLRKWQKRINLVGASTVADLWTRHFEDSLQLLPLAGPWRNWVDLGSGAGFPGMVVALATADPNRTVHLIESDKRKASFLREVSRETKIKVEIHADRIERVLPELISQDHIDIISARALAPLSALISYSRPAFQKGAVGLFLKGKGLAGELTQIGGEANLRMTLIDSQTDAAAKIVVVRDYDFQTNST